MAKWSAIIAVGMAKLPILFVNVLSHFLKKEVFGHWALAIAVIMILHSFVDMGSDSAIIQRGENTENVLNSLYWVNLRFALLMALLVYPFGHLISAFFASRSCWGR